jgi:hypothetical protein
MRNLFILAILSNIINILLPPFDGRSITSIMIIFILSFIYIYEKKKGCF